MFKQFLNNVQGADVPMVTSLLIFFIFFILLTVYLFIMDKNHIKYMSDLPINEDKHPNS
jgi:hypothetical protein